MKTKLLLKRICALFSLTLLLLLVVLFLIINSPLVSRTLEHYLSNLTGQTVLVDSARISLFPPISLVAKSLSVQEQGENDPFIVIQNTLVEINAFKLLNREIYVSRLDIDGCSLLLAGDQDYNGILVPLFLAVQMIESEDDTVSKKPSAWTIKSINMRLKNGSIGYRGERKTKDSRQQNIEDIHTEASITGPDMDISFLKCSYRDAGVTLSGSINNFLENDPAANLQIKGEVPFSAVKAYLPEQISTKVHEGHCTVSLNARGPLSQLLIDSELNIRSSTDSPLNSYTPADISLKTLVQNKEHLQLEHVKISSPLGTLAMHGAVKNFLSAGRQFNITHTAQVKLNQLVQYSDSDITLKGTLPVNGVIEGEAESFDTTTHLDLSPVSITIPGVLTVAEGDLGSAEIVCSKKSSTLNMVARVNDSFSSNLTLKGNIENIWSTSKAFAIDLQGILFLPGVTKAFSILKAKDVTVRGESPVQIALKGSVDNSRSVKLAKGTLSVLGSSLALTGKLSHLFSEQLYLSLESTLSFNAEQFSSHLPGIVDETWELDIPRAINLSIQGPITNLLLKADFDLKGFDFKSPHFSLKEPLTDGDVAFEASLVNQSDVDIHTFLVRLKQSQVSLSGRIKSRNLEMSDAYLEAKGVFKAEEILPLLPEPLPEQYSLEGTSLLQAVFKGNPADSFTMEAVIDLTDSSWEDPYLISKKAGIKNRAAISISRDYSTNSFEGEGDIVLESAQVNFSLRYPSSNPNQWHVELKSPPFELSKLTSFKFHQRENSYKGQIAIDLSASVNPAHLMESSVNGYVEVDNFFTSINNQDVLVNTQLIAHGDRIEVPSLNLQFGSSDFELWQTTFSWGDVPQLETTITSQSLYLKNFMPAAQEEPLQDESPEVETLAVESPADEPLADEPPDKSDPAPVENFLWRLLERKPHLDINVEIDKLVIGNRAVRNMQLLVIGNKGIFNLVSSLQTEEGESSIRAEISGPFADKCVEESLQFKISGFNMTEFADFFRLENPPFTGVVYADGDIRHFSNPKERWINPENLDGQVHIRFEDGEIRELAIITNLLSLMRYPIALAIPVVQWIFLSDIALNWLQTRQVTTLSRTMPYDLIKGSFVIDDGLVATEDLLLTGKVLNIAAALTIDMLDDNAVNGLVISRYYSSLGNLMGWIPILGDLLIALQDRFIASRFEVSGTLGDPKVTSLAWKKLTGGTRSTFDTMQNRLRWQGE